MTFICKTLDTTFCGVENCSRFPTASLPVDTVGQWADEIFLCTLHDLLTHLVKLLGVVDPAVKLGVGIRELCKFNNTQGKGYILKTFIWSPFGTGFSPGELVSVTFKWLSGKNIEEQNTHAVQCVDSRSVSSVCLPSLHPLHRTVNKSEAFRPKDKV